MRHLGSLLLSVVLAPVVWFLAGLGLSEYGQARIVTSAEPPPELFVGLAALLVAGLLYTLLVLPRLSPIGPVLTGSAFLAVSAWSALDMVSFHQTLPRRFLGTDFVLTAPGEGLAVLLAFPLLATVFSPRRWRGRPIAALYAGPPAGYPGQLAGYPGQPAGYAGQPAGYPGPAATTPSYPHMPYPSPPPGVLVEPSPTVPLQATSGISRPPNLPVRPFSGPQQRDAETELDTMRLTTPGHHRRVEETTRIVAPTPAPPDDTATTEPPTSDLGGDTTSLRDTPPPPAAYPPPGHAAPTSPPVDPDATRQL